VTRLWQLQWPLALPWVVPSERSIRHRSSSIIKWSWFVPRRHMREQGYSRLLWMGGGGIDQKVSAVTVEINSVPKLRVTSHQVPQFISDKWYAVLTVVSKLACNDVIRVHTDSVVGVATRYRLDGPGIETPGGGGYFQHPSKPALRPTQSPIQ
jgi:hypothetical protein